MMKLKEANDFRGFGLVSMIRTKVFVIEQGCPPPEEFDELDNEATHYLGWVDDEVVITCRTLFPKNGVAKIGRIACLEEYRGNGYALKLLEDLIEIIKARGDIEFIKLSAQTQAMGLYAKLGFEAHGDIYEEAAIPHCMMSKKL